LVLDNERFRREVEQRMASASITPSAAQSQKPHRTQEQSFYSDPKYFGRTLDVQPPAQLPRRLMSPAVNLLLARATPCGIERSES
jgi:hypothetical protein